MIRQLQEQRKGPSQLQPPTTTTTAAAAVAQHHQHLLQMNAAAAAYERALKVSSDSKCKQLFTYFKFLSFTSLLC
jgi:hypothetical protein